MSRDPHNSAALILTHGRPDRVHTVETLQRSGWTRPVYIVIDDEDETADEYRNRFGDQVIQFSKEEVEQHIDIADTGSDRRTITYARNAAFDIAEELGLDYFIQLDDDYRQLSHRFKRGDSLANIHIKRFDAVFDAMVEYLELSGAKSVAMGQAGDLLGGVYRDFTRLRVKRKAMNSFVCRTDNRFEFVGRMNEDVNTYVSLGSRGELFFTFLDVSVNQQLTQSQPGGITELYEAFGTYSKAFYTVMVNPSCVKVGMMNSTNPRIHHSIKWDHAVPKIISDRYRKT